MDEAAALEQLQARLAEVFEASMDLIGLIEPTERVRYIATLSAVQHAWHELAEAAPPERRADLANRTATVLARTGDDLFYGQGAADEAIAAFELALMLAPQHAESLQGIIAAYLQGAAARPERALPFAERLAAIDPRREPAVTYIRSLINRG